MQVPAKVDYAVRAMLELAAAHPARLNRDELAARQTLPGRYLESILRELVLAGLIVGHRGLAGGYELARPATEVTIADIARAVDGPLALVAQQVPEDVHYDGASHHLSELWVGLRAAIRSVLEHVTLAELLVGEFPPAVRLLLDDPDAWAVR